MYVFLSGPCTIAMSSPRLCSTPRTEISATVSPAAPSPFFDAGALAAQAEQVQERIAPAVGLIRVGRVGRLRRRRAARPARRRRLGRRRRLLAPALRERGLAATTQTSEQARSRTPSWSRRPSSRRQPASWRPRGRAWPPLALSSSTKVVAVALAVIVEFAAGLSLPLMSSPLMLTMRVNLPTRSKKIARLWYVPSSSQGDRPLGVQLLGDDRRRLEALDRQVGLRRHRLHPAQQVRRVLLVGQHGLQAVEPRLQVGDLRSELGELLRRREALADVGAQRHELLLARRACRRAPASRSRRRTPPRRPAPAPGRRPPVAYHGSFVRLSSMCLTLRPYRGIRSRALRRLRAVARSCLSAGLRRRRRAGFDAPGC